MRIDDAGRRTALDGARRRRVYLFRHGSVDYFDASGKVVPDTDKVELSSLGRQQANLMHDLFADVSIDAALCSGLPRTLETGRIILGKREVELRPDPGFVEIRQRQGDAPADFDVLADVAFSHFRAEDEEARFLGGERYSDFYNRIVVAIDNLLAVW